MDEAIEVPTPGRHYWHFKGTIYTVIDVAVICDGPLEGETCVVYRKKADDGQRFVRSLTDWNSTTDTGEARFTRA